MFMSDSLNKFFEDAGKAVSEKLFGNKSENPAGATRFSGVYIGPGGGVTKTDSFDIDGTRYGAAFAPIGYFDKTNQWIDDRLSTIIGTPPGITRGDFPKDTAPSVVFGEKSTPYNAIGMGFTPPGFFDPKATWYDDRLSTLLTTLPGITRKDLPKDSGAGSVTFAGGLSSNVIESPYKYIGYFTPPGFFDSNKSWIKDRLSVNFSGIPGISRADFPKNITDGRTGDEVDYSINGDGPYFAVSSGFTPPGFFNTQDLWLDIRFSRIVTQVSGDNRSSASGLTWPSSARPPRFFHFPSQAPLQRLEDPDNNPYVLPGPGFTPVFYYRTGKEIFLKPRSLNGEDVGIVTFKEAESYTKKTGPKGFYESKISADYRFKFGLEDDRLSTTTEGKLPVTPLDNEDPLYTGFEVVINTATSPLFNGEAANFISKFLPNTEIKARGQVLRDYINEMKKFFKFNLDPRLTEFSEPGLNEYIFTNTPSIKRHYVKKISGINKLIEQNTPSAQSAFVKYRNDLITLSFYEDTTLELGTLMTLYKTLYWSRLNGKNIIPENLLRFDCKVIVSEVRNFTRVKKAASIGDLITLKENVSRYVYDLYECQLFFDKMSHGDVVTMDTMTSPDSSEISMSWKYSTMRFERYDFLFGGGRGVYKFLDNKQLAPQRLTSNVANRAIVTENEIVPYAFNFLPKLNNGYSGKDRETPYVSSTRFKSLNAQSEDEGATEGNEGATEGSTEESQIDDLKNNQKLSIYQRSFDKVVPENDTKSAGIYPTGSGSEEENKVPLSKDSNFKGNSGIYPSINKNSDEEAILSLAGGASSPINQIPLKQNSLFNKTNGIYPAYSPSGSDSENEIPLNKDSLFKKAGDKLLQNIKKAALNEAQRQLNNQFRLVNNSLDKVRNSFGIGRMREPTNVYNNLPNAQFFFDVKNSLRDFGGDVLGGLLGG